MNSSLHVFRRLLILRGCNRIITSRYGNDRKTGETADGDEFESHDSTGGRPTPTEPLEQVGVKNMSGDDSVRNPVRESRNDSVSNKSRREKIRSEKKFIPKVPELTNEGDDIIRIYSTAARKRSEDGFLAAYKRQEEILNQKITSEKTQGSKTFAELLRKSPFIDLGDPVGKVVLGEVHLVVGNDLYIDFGWKFHTVCSLPKKNSEKYVPGVKVLLIIKDLELSAKFLGEKKYISLLEADCDLLGIYQQRRERAKQELSEESE